MFRPGGVGRFPGEADRLRRSRDGHGRAAARQAGEGFEDRGVIRLDHCAVRIVMPEQACGLGKAGGGILQLRGRRQVAQRLRVQGKAHRPVRVARRRGLHYLA